MSPSASTLRGRRPRWAARRLPLVRFHGLIALLSVLIPVEFAGTLAAADFEQSSVYDALVDPFSELAGDRFHALTAAGGNVHNVHAVWSPTAARRRTNDDGWHTALSRPGQTSPPPTFAPDHFARPHTAPHVTHVSTVYLPQRQDAVWDDSQWNQSDWNNQDGNGPSALDLRRQAGGKGLFRDRPWIVNGPSVPEPMVFDMVRPMHARKGELEANVLTVVPMHRRRKEVDWAPEVEIAIADGVGVEFEFPFLDDRLQSLKFAGQYTFDVGLNNRLIHGYHGIYEHFFDGKVSEFTSLYLVGVRFNEVWSVMGMFGFRSTVEAQARSHFTELIQNVSFFADVTDRVILGVETNMSHLLAGPSTLLIMPQSHIILTDNLTLQVGFGLEAAADHAVPVHAFRLVLER